MEEVYKKLTIKYVAGHSYDYEYLKTDLHCPNCGKQEVWVINEQGDYYLGASHYCLNCKADFTLQIYVPESEDGISFEDKQVFRGLSGVIDSE